MSQQITEAMVNQYSANVFHLSQQKGSRLQNFVRRETQRAESAFWDRIGSVEAQDKGSRHADTPLMDTPHSRRMVTLIDKQYADLIDTADRVRTIMDPTNPYAQAAVWALGRAKDTEIIRAALGDAFSGKRGQTAVPLPNAQKIVSINSGGTDGAGLNVEALRFAKEKLDAAEVDEDIPRYFYTNAAGLRNLLRETEVTSSDFNTVKALVRGEINQYMGFTFVRGEKVPLQVGALSANFGTGIVGSGGGNVNGYFRNFCWAQDGLLLSTAQEITVDIGPRRDKNMSTQVYAEMGIGATRMEEVKVVEVLTKA